MTSKNNKAPLLYYIKLCASFQIHQWIQTRVTVRKCSILVKIGDFLPCLTLKFDGWPWKTIGHLSYTTLSFVQHFKAIDIFKLELQSGNAQFGSKLVIFLSPMTLKIDRWPSKTIGPLFYTGLYYILVWYSRSVHPEKWHALYDVNACENHDPGKRQAMHDANACENYIAIILWRQSPYLKCMWNHQCIAT